MRGEEEDIRDALSGLITKQEMRRTATSLFNSSPNDESYYNSGYGQHHHQNAHLLPGARLNK